MLTTSSSTQLTDLNWGRSRSKDRFDAVSDWIANKNNFAPQAPAPAPAAAPAQAPTPVYSGGGYGYDAGAARAAAAAEAAARAAKIAQVKQAQEQIFTTGRLGGNTLVSNYDTQTRDFTRGIETGQQGINANRATNALNLRRSMASIADDARQQTRSGASALGNMNALDSGAAEAYAKAIGRSSGKQVNQTRNEAGLKTIDADRQQAALDQQRNDAIIGLNRNRDLEVDRVFQETKAKLDALNAEAGIAGVVDLAGADRIRAQAIEALHAIDLMRDARLANARALTPEEIQAEAVRLDQLGAGATPFDYDQTNVSLPGSGPDLTNLPIYVKPREDASPLGV